LVIVVPAILRKALKTKKHQRSAINDEFCEFVADGLKFCFRGTNACE
jgi:hypothetical protein